MKQWGIKWWLALVCLHVFCRNNADDKTGMHALFSRPYRHFPTTTWNSRPFPGLELSKLNSIPFPDFPTPWEPWYSYIQGFLSGTEVDKYDLKTLMDIHLFSCIFIYTHAYSFIQGFLSGTEGISYDLKTSMEFMRSYYCPSGSEATIDIMDKSIALIHP